MSGKHEDASVIELAAAVWAVRSQNTGFREADIIALTEWLEASDAHADAYRRALGVWLDAGDAAETAAPVDNVIHLASHMRPAPKRRNLLGWGVGGAVAAGLAAVVGVSLYMTQPVPTETYSTAKGERRAVTLADGTKLMLNTDSQVSVAMGRTRREVTLTRGEVSVEVAADARRPFALDTEDLRITDIGTEFNVLRDDDAVQVTVKSGMVSLKPAGAGSQPLTVQAGQQGIHRNGALTSSLKNADPQQAFAWRTSHAIYRDQPLALVVKDLNRYFDKPIVVDEEAGKLRLTAILTLDSERAVVGRLEQFLPLDAKTTDKAIVLRRAAGDRPGGA
ncbi:MULTISPECIES: FecR domain-containing protein [Asticcacaulis]|uniref:FecR family protein n=1 Tax=Asticcacaulis TaxID=76890 RepID=UPI001AE4EF85|nr:MULTISPECIES: FecR domain-containing protein [Asticcacaulis]MBP2161695.1 transmembrane sensor [Asticcacaulis solisilvae]MDR6802680.1 transmembrane sensor [Asticcacaulis sp. BE141]